MDKVKVFYGVNESLNCKAIELPYVDNKLSLFLILPDHTVTDIHAVERSLTVDHLDNITESFNMRKRKVDIWIPRFKLDEKMGLEDVLAKMGIVDLFQEGKADLSGMNSSKGLHISKVLHRAFVEVNEEGSEAAAATALVVVCYSSMISKPEEPCEFRADHPFLFFIRDNATKSILFLGRLTKP